MDFDRDASTLIERLDAQNLPYPLSGRAVALVSQLPSSIDLPALRSDYPELLDLLAGCWDNPHTLARTFDQLLFGSGRGGLTLSLAALLELTDLQRHAAARFLKRRRSAWDLASEGVA